MENAHRTIELIARSAYGRLVAFLSAQTRDVASAEDALSDALLEALTAWPRDGVPESPEAWLSPPRAIASWIRGGARARASGTTNLLRSVVERARNDEGDRRVSRRAPRGCYLVCAHPAIDPALHAPLMLQAVLGLEAARIAPVFVVSPAAMGQRLVRAKTKIREASIAFEVPGERELPQRLDSVLEAIYAAYGLGTDGIAGRNPRRAQLAEEAIWLARVLAGADPQRSGGARAPGTLALLRVAPSRAADGDRRVRASLRAGSRGLGRADHPRGRIPAIRRGKPTKTRRAIPARGRDPIGACGSAAHRAHRLGRDRALLRPTSCRSRRRSARSSIAPSPRPRRAGLKLASSSSMPSNTSAVVSYQPYWAVRAHLSKSLHRGAEAAKAYDLAIGLTQDAAVRRFLIAQRR